MTERDRLLVVQPYVPEYRVPLFRNLRTRLAEHGIDFVLATGRPGGDDRARGDDWTVAEADVVLAERRVRLGSKVLLMRNVNSVLHAYRPHMVIIEQALKNLEIYPLLVRRRLGSGYQVGMWGQGRSFSTPSSRLEASLKMALTRSADWFFAYTSEGARYVATEGFDASRVTTLDNTIDTRSLKEGIRLVDENGRADFITRHGLVAGRTALFIGGLDERKGIDFLLEAAQGIREELPGFTLLVAGSGAKSEQVADLEHRGGPIRWLGRLEGPDKALALAVADVLMIPEWVGLVAVDSLASGTPIVTTDHPSHSPEFAYLKPDVTAVVTEHDVKAYVQGVVALLKDPGRLGAMREACIGASARFSTEAMAERFVAGIVAWRSSSPR